MTAYYRDAVRLTVLSDVAGTVTLGRGRTPIVILEHAPELRHAGPRQAGLFHTAVLFETEADLAASVYEVAQRHPRTFTGSADHLVSKAFYFTDPEGNGVELYWDRDRTEWSWTHGRVEMNSLFLDPNDYLRRTSTRSRSPRPTSARRASGTSTSVSATCPPRTASTSTSWGSRRPRSGKGRPCSSARAATTTTWP